MYYIDYMIRDATVVQWAYCDDRVFYHIKLIAGQNILQYFLTMITSEIIK